LLLLPGDENLRKVIEIKSAVNKLLGRHFGLSLFIQIAQDQPILPKDLIGLPKQVLPLPPLLIMPGRPAG
jgi:hypothetical protein